MSDAFWVALFGFMGTFVMQYFVWKKVNGTSEHVEQLKVSTNGMKDAQIMMTEQLGMMKGEKKGRADKAAEIKQEQRENGHDIH